jgi:hypothetical protein
MWYRFAQDGDFIEFPTLRVFTGQFDSHGWAPMAPVAVGDGFDAPGLIDSAGLPAVAACGTYGDRFSVDGWDPCSPYGSLSGCSFDRFGVSPWAAAPFGCWYVSDEQRRPRIPQRPEW